MQIGHSKRLYGRPVENNSCHIQKQGHTTILSQSKTLSNKTGKIYIFIRQIFAPHNKLMIYQQMFFNEFLKFKFVASVENIL